MGQLVNGLWHDRWYDTKKTKGEFVRSQSQFRNWITVDGQPGPSGKGGFKAESGRYHLYVSDACPWAHRTIIFRLLKKLSDHISISMVHPHMLDRGWEFVPTHPNLRDPINYCRYLYEIYLLADPFYSGNVTVPVLWDKQLHTIVNNESAEIIRMMNTAFNGITGNNDDYYPAQHHQEIDHVNTFIYENINNGVYRCGFATEQAAYNQAFDGLFNALALLEKRLADQQYLIHDTLTESDWRLFTTLIRFDVVYYSHFKCNFHQIADYPNLFQYLKRLYNHPGIAQTVNFEHIKQHYYYSHVQLNPTRIVPKGPVIDLSLP
jgi:putative glutathione S-transferase